MSETTPPPHNSNRFFAWLRGLGIVRGNDRWFAGVAGGIAAKAGIDPLIVRGIFVVLALLGGPGIILYLVGWLLLPDFNGNLHLESVMRGRASAGVITTVVILGALVAIPLFFRVLPGLFFNPWAWDVWGNVGLEWVGHGFTILWWAIIVPALIIWFIVWLIRRGSRSANGNPGSHDGAGTAQQAEQPQNFAFTNDGHTSTGPASTGPASTGPVGAGTTGTTDGSQSWGNRTSAFAENVGKSTTDFADKAEQAAGQFSEKATEWGEQASAWGEKVGNDAKEWDRNARAYYETHKLGAAHTVLTLAIALLAAGAAAAWAISGSLGNDLVVTISLLSAVSVLAVSTIIAGIRGRGSGWVGFFAFLGVLALIFAPFSTLLPSQTSFVPFGNLTKVATDHEPNNATVMLAGNSTLDLTQLTSNASYREIDVWVLMGNSRIELPTTTPVQVHTNVIGGEIRDDQGGAGSLSNGDAEKNNREGSSESRFGSNDNPVRQTGIFLKHTIGANLDGASESQTIHVNVRLLFGSVRIYGADSSAVSSTQQSETSQARSNAPLAHGLPLGQNALAQHESAELEMTR